MARLNLLTPSLLILSLELLNGSLSAAEASEPSTSSLELQQGYRRERFDFLAGSKSGHDGLRSKLHSKHIDVYSSRLLFKCKSDKGIFLQAQGGYGHVLRGRADFTGHFRHHSSNEVNRTGFHTARDYTMDFGLFWGKEFRYSNGVALSPRIGYTFYHQKFHFKNAILKNHHDRRLHGFHGKYRANWYAPQLALRAEKDISERFSVFGDYTFMWPLKYRASGTSNKRANDSLNFHNRSSVSHSWGHAGVVGGKFSFNPNWSLNLEYELAKFFAKKGHQRLHNEKVPLHKAHRSTSEVRLALCYNF